MRCGGGIFDFGFAEELSVLVSSSRALAFLVIFSLLPRLLFPRKLCCFVFDLLPHRARELRRVFSSLGRSLGRVTQLACVVERRMKEGVGRTYIYISFSRRHDSVEREISPQGWGRYLMVCRSVCVLGERKEGGRGEHKENTACSHRAVPPAPRFACT